MEQLNSSIKSAKNILLISHINPDGDTLGSMCALYSAIKDNYKKKCTMVTVSAVPSTYEFLPYIKNAVYIKDMDLSREFDMAVCIDVASLDRCADAEALFKKAKITVNIDHHGTNPEYAQINIVKPETAAASEVLCDIFAEMNWKISKDTAICLYTGIVTDTGNFRFSNTTPHTLECAAKLLSCGIDPAEIYGKCYESNSKNMVLFQAYCVNKAEFLNDDKIAYTIVYKKDLEKYNYGGEDFTDGLTEKLRAIKTTEIAFVVKELNSSVSKVSMRSRTKDISKVCAAFGGGGHKLAAGAVIKGHPKQVISQIIEEIKKQGLC